jgi:hypothetical protein
MTDDFIPQTKPRCFPTHKHFAIWMQAAKHTGGCFDVGHCTDCTPEYKNRMMAQRRCDHPEIQFAPDEHGFIQGVIHGQANTAPNASRL